MDPLDDAFQRAAHLARDLDAKVGMVLLHQGNYTGALAKLEESGQVRSIGRARTRRWLSPPLGC